LESLERRDLLSTLVLPSASRPALAVTAPLNQDGTVSESDRNEWGGNFLGTLDGAALSASYCVSIDLTIYVGSAYDSASATSDGTIYGAAVPNAGAISWLLTNIGPTAATPFQQDALQAAIWRIEYGDTFQLDGVDNTNSEPTINATVAPIYQADLAALGSNTAPVGNVDWISAGANSDGSQGQGLVAMKATGGHVLALANTVFPSFTVTLNLHLPDGDTRDESGAQIAGGNFMGTLDGTPLASTYCVALDLVSAPPVNYDYASIAGDGTIYRTDVPNAGAISWLLRNIGPTATSSDQQAALQAAIWRTEYGDGFQLDGVDNGNYAPDNSSIAPIYQADLFAASDNTAPVGDEYWIATGPNPDATEGQGLVALPVASATNTTVTSSANPSYMGKSVTFTATVSNTSPNSADTPTGSVQFQIDGSNYGSTVVLADGTASVSDGALGAGTHTLQAIYMPDNIDLAGSTSDLYNQVVVAQVTLGNLSPTQWTVNQPGYDGTISVTGGSGGYQDLNVSGLPAGLRATLVSSTDNGQQSGAITISGTPTQIGTFSDIAVSVEDNNGVEGNGTETLTVYPALSLGDLIGVDLWTTDDPASDDTPQDVYSSAAEVDDHSPQTPPLAAISTSLDLGNLKPEKADVGEPYEGTSRINVGGAPSSSKPQYSVSYVAPEGWNVELDTHAANTIKFAGTPAWSTSVANPVETLTFQVTVHVTINNTTSEVSKTFQLPVQNAVQDLLDHNNSHLQNLNTGELVPIGPPTSSFDCFAYAANPSNPLAPGLGWVTGLPFSGMMNLYGKYGWYPVANGSTPPYVPRSGLVVIYEVGRTPTHAALVTTRGVFAKMGHLGTYKFSNVNQMAGGTFGQPAVWLAKTSAITAVQLTPPRSGTYNGQPFTATATILVGFNGTDFSRSAGTSLEGVPVELQYYAGSSTAHTPPTGTPLPSAPVNPGTYTVMATFRGSTDYTSSRNWTTFTISKAAPMVKVRARDGKVITARSRLE